MDDNKGNAFTAAVHAQVFFTATGAGATVTGIIPDVLYTGYTVPAAFGFSTYRMPWETNATVFESFAAETQTFVASGSVVIGGVVSADSESIEIDVASGSIKAGELLLGWRILIPRWNPPESE